MNKTLDETQRAAVFRALSHDVRRQIIDHLFDRPGSSVGEVAAQFDSSRIAVMKHLRVLETARLVLSKKQGRTRRLYFNPVPLHEIAEHWRERYASAWSTSLLDLKNRVEGKQTPPTLANQPIDPDSPSRPLVADSLPEEPS